MDFRSGSGVGAKAPTPVTVRLAPHCADLPAAGRTTSFRRLSLRRRLVCRAGQSSRTKNDRQSCPTRRERARPSKEPTTRQKAATSPAQPRLQGQKISRHGADEPPPLRRTNHPRCVVRTTPAASCGEGWFVCCAVRPTYPRLATYTDWQIRYYRFLYISIDSGLPIYQTEASPAHLTPNQRAHHRRKVWGSD